MARRLTTLLTCATLICGWALPTNAQPSTEEAAADEFDRAWALGDLAQLRDRSKARDDSPSMCVRAELALLDAQLADAERFARLAVERATNDGEAECGVAVLAIALLDQGERAVAESTLRNHLAEHPQAHRVRLELGRLLVDRGARDEAEIVLDALSRFFNNNALKTAADFTILSSAMALIDSYDDANFAMQHAIKANPYSARALVRWGDLLLSKYNTADAEVTYDEALQLNPNNVDALVGKARVELELSNDYATMRNLLDRAQEHAPQHVGMLLTRAEIAIYDTNCEDARGFAQQVLNARPQQLAALTILAACDYLDDDKAAFEAAKKKVLDLNPMYARLLSETANYAVRVHRYEEATALDREALQLVPDHAPSLLGLGIGLSRVGKEDEAVQMLRRAFEVDRYNVRAFNMVELYDKQMKQYAMVDHGRYLLRAHDSEKNLINALVHPVVDEALAEFDAKYGFKPSEDYLSVEVFPHPTTFAVRSVGLPHVSPHGICFGKVVVSRSPSDGNFNWRQVIWHELAHVYHIQMANSRMPRWFTEGLAEYETNVKDPGWQRHHDRELARALDRGTLRGVLDLSEGFTHARTLEEVLRSYHQSSLVIHFIAEQWDFEKLPAMLRAWGAYQKTPEVLQSVLGVTAAEFDAQFERWLRRRYLNFHGQLTVDLASIPSAREMQLKVDTEPTNALAWAQLVVARFREDDVAAADQALVQALRRGASDPVVLAIAAIYTYQRGRVRDAYTHAQAVLDLNRDAYDLRILLGNAAVKLELYEDAEVHFRAAATLWEGGAEAWHGLSRIARANKDDALQSLSQDRLYLLDQNDPQIARSRVDAMRQRQDWAAMADAARRWIDINPTDSRSHEALIEAARALSRPEIAVDAWAALAVLRPSDAEDILLPAIRELRAAQQTELVERLRKQALDLGVPESKL